MAKDDYDFLVFRILTYLYACFRRRCHFETTAFMKRIQEESEACALLAKRSSR
jgi:hypothetical protein